MNPKGEQLYLKPDEAKFISMAIVGMLEDLQSAYKNSFINFNPEARKDLKEMILAGNSLKIKLQKLGLDMRDLPDYAQGDEDEFLTKQS